MTDRKLFFYKGVENILEKYVDQDDYVDKSLSAIRDNFHKVLDSKNLSFLLGSGVSSYEVSTSTDSEAGEKSLQQIGIPVMSLLANEFYSEVLTEEENKFLKNVLRLNVKERPFSNNLEHFLSTLHSLSFFNTHTIRNEDLKAKRESDEKEDKSDDEDLNGEETYELKTADQVDLIISKTRNYLLKKCLNEKNNEEGKDEELIKLYKLFYRKLLSRNATLSRLNIFTTNYDLYSERAFDQLGVHYVNGFTGGISKYFNPAIFNYALAEKMDLSQSKWSVIDNFFYLYKLHGSVNWVEDKVENKLFNVREVQDPKFDSLHNRETIMIFPTPLKYNASLGSPYSDLFREFQKKLMQNNNVLVTIGYSFSDEHINNLIFQAFTIPSFRLIIIGDPESSKAIEKLKEMNDSRIWIIGESIPDTDNQIIPLHYFKRFVDEILPDLNNEELDEKMEQTYKLIQEIYDKGR